MGFYSAWPYFFGMATILLVAATPILAWADTPPKAAPARVRTIDGLRGFLALGVLFHHAATYHQYLQSGVWSAPPSRFYADLGQVGVAMFFMITGYLFWTQMLNAQGKPDFSKLYVGRLFRIAPLYLLLAGFVLAAVGVLTGWRLDVAPAGFLGQTARWLAGGILVGGDVNGCAGAGLLTAYVTWTLQYEWLFYASLILLAVFARNPVSGALMPIVGLVGSALLLQLHPDNSHFAASALTFCVGMTTASVKKVATPIPAPQWALSAGALGCLAFVLLLCDGASTVLPLLVLGIAFALVVFGATIFGLLSSRPAIRLGDISYGVYLLQGPVLFLAFAPPWVRALALGSPWLHWTVAMLASLALVTLAAVTHVPVERPGIRAGQRVLARIGARRPARLRLAPSSAAGP